MIKSIHIKNFMSLEEIHLDLSNGVNALIGETDHGKSAVIRALLWVIKNRPLGVGFRPWYTDKPTSVKLTLDTDDIVFRKRSKSENYYLLSGPSSDEELKLTAFGNGPPPNEVLEILKIHEDSIHTQHSAPFLLGVGGAEVARHFNRIAGIEDIDKSKKNIRSWTTELKNDFKRSESLISSLKAEIKGYLYLNELEGVFDAVRCLLDKIRRSEATKNKIIEVINQIQGAEEEVARLAKYNKIKKKAKAVFEKADELGKIIQDAKELRKQINEYRAAEQRLKVATAEFRDKQAILKKIMPDICPFCDQEIKR